MKQILKSVTLILLLSAISCSEDSTENRNGVESKIQILSRPINPVLDSQVKIGNQYWMTKNLSVSKYRNGDIIPQVQDPTEWANLTTGAWCYYQNNAVHGSIYGKLYNWYAVNDTRGLAPTGWHVPTNAEWTTLTTAIGGMANGGSLKEVGTSHWVAPNNGATNSSGFTALPTDRRNVDGSFIVFTGYDGYWWTATSTGATGANTRNLQTGTSEIFLSFTNKHQGLSVRCVKN
jgi:uncharacterized protein (TIGR02145 family)